MAGLKVTGCAHDNPNTKQNGVLSDVLSLYLYNFQNNQEQLHITEKILSLLGYHGYCLSLQSIQMNIKAEESQTYLQDNTPACYFPAASQM